MNCKNCHAELIDGSDFCHNCGAKIIRNRLTFRNLFEHISETFFNYDNKLLRTFIDMFVRPEEVMGGYIDGIRKRYVNPISYFGLALTLTGVYLLVLTKYFPELNDYSAFVQEGQEEFQRQNMMVVQEYQSLFMMLYIPFYALMAKISFFGLKKFNYTELLVIFIYIQAQISIFAFLLSIITISLGITQGTAGFIMMPFMILYAGYCLKRLYGLSLGDMLVRTLLFFVVLIGFLVIFTVIFLVFAYFNGTLEEMVKAQQAARGN